MSNIEWTEKTWNPIVGCSVVSPGCTNCYAMKMAARLEKMLPPERRGDNVLPNHYSALTQPSKAGPVWTGRINRAPEHILLEPLRRKKPTMYFVNSMSDLFHESVPDEWIDRIFAVMALSPRHTFQVLTKRSARMRRYFQIDHNHDYQDRIDAEVVELSPHLREPKPITWPLSNVWLGASAEDQKRADERIPDLLATPAAVRFVSAEPLLGPIDLTRYYLSDKHGRYPFPMLSPEDRTTMVELLDWIIVGGESGPGARPMHPDWARSIRDQCNAVGVAFFFKQWGRFVPQHDDPEELYFASEKGEFANHAVDRGWCFGRSPNQRPWMMFDIGKKAAGRLLDGREWNEMPARAEKVSAPASVETFPSREHVDG